MGRFSGASKKAAEETEAQLESELKGFLSLGPTEVMELFPVTADRDFIDATIDKVNKATSTNEKAQAVKALALELSDGGLKNITKLVKLAGKIALAILLFSMPARAVETMSFGEVLKVKAMEMKAVYSINWVTKDGESGHVRHSGGAYLPIHTLTSGHENKEDRLEYLDWGIGIEEPEGSEKTGIIVPVMANAIALSKRALSSDWSKKHIRSTSLPDVWIGILWHPPVNWSKRGLKEYKILESIGPALSIRFSGPWFTKKEEK